MSVDLNGLLANIMKCDATVEEALAFAMRAADDLATARGNLAEAQMAFDSAVREARGSMPATGSLQVVQETAPTPAPVPERKIPMGGLPPTSPALAYDRLAGAIDDADDARPDNVEAT